jgi:hypothetical protein
MSTSSAPKSENYITVLIPIKTYLVKFIGKFKEIEPFYVKKNNCHISAIILDQVKKYYSKNRLSFHEDKYTNFECKIPLSENRFTVDQETVLRINQNLDHMFDQQLIDMVSMSQEKRGDILESIQIFLKYYELEEDDLAVPTCVKMYYRARYPRDESDKKIKEDVRRWEQLQLFAS